VQIALALTRAANAGIERIHFKIGTYDINNLTIATPVEITGEEGVVWDFPATPSLTTSVAVTFRNMEFYSDFDGQGHVVLGGDTVFEDIHFNFELDTEAETFISVMVSNAANSRIEIFNCQLTGGESGAEYFGLLRFAADGDELIVRNFRVNNIIVDDAAVGRGHIFKINNGVTVNYMEFRNIEVLAATIQVHLSILQMTVGSALEYLEMTGVTFSNGTYGDADSEFDLMNCFEAMTTCVLEDIEIHGQSHAVLQASSLNITDMRLYLTGNDPAFDLGASDTVTGMSAVVTNCYLDGLSFDMNTGWRSLAISNSKFINSRINIIDEEAGHEGQEKSVNVDNCQWWMTSGGFVNSCIVCSYGQGVDLEYLQVSNCKFESDGTGNLAVFNASGAITTDPPIPTHLIFDHIVVEPRIGAAWPKLITGTPRVADHQIVWIFDSVIWTQSPPLGNWSVAAIGIYDKFDGVTWWDTATSNRLYSENCGVATVDNGTNSEVVNHGLACLAATRFATPDCVLLTGAENHLEAAQMIRDTLTATQFTIRYVGGGNVTADRDVQWRARMTR